MMTKYAIYANDEYLFDAHFVRDLSPEGLLEAAKQMDSRATRVVLVAEAHESER